MKKLNLNMINIVAGCLGVIGILMIHTYHVGWLTGWNRFDSTICSQFHKTRIVTEVSKIYLMCLNQQGTWDRCRNLNGGFYDAQYKPAKKLTVIGVDK